MTIGRPITATASPNSPRNWVEPASFLLGAHHGAFCVGCCWALMLVMFVVGMGNLGLMFAVGGVMAAEKNLPWGRRLSTPLGVGLLLLALGIGRGVIGNKNVVVTALQTLAIAAAARRAEKVARLA